MCPCPHRHRNVTRTLARQVLTYGFWHAITYAGHATRGPLAAYKFSPDNPYETDARVPVGFVASTTGCLQVCVRRAAGGRRVRVA